VPTPEGLVLKAVCTYLALQENLGRCVFWRQNNGGTYDPRRKVFRAVTGVGYKYGVSDVCLLLAPSGRFAAVECKAAKGVLSEHQKTLKKAIEAVGGIYIVARGVGDIEHLFIKKAP
jgi:hypothetical protein